MPPLNTPIPATPDRLREQLIELYGPLEGERSAAVLIPAIFRDFDKELDKVERGVSVRETYRTEDGVAQLDLTGYRDDEGRAVLFGSFVRRSDREEA